MLFYQYSFLVYFLPITFMLFSICGRKSIVLLLASIVFYASWSVPFLFMLLAITVFGYCGGLVLGQKRAKTTFMLAICVVLMPLLYFKYGHFLNDNFALHIREGLLPRTLPLGISFYTFEQITYLADVYRGDKPTRSISKYALFTLFFPHLIAGPILRPTVTIPQFEQLAVCPKFFNAGAFLFAVGLVKKLGIADHFAPTVDLIYAAAGPLTFWQSLEAVLSYSLQIYFDFSGYSDMAIGLALMFGVSLPINFDSPYKSASLAEFWRRWHMSLSLFFRDYVYIPLGGNRHGLVRQLRNLLMTMVLCGFWHGASWTFGLWGFIHGVGLALAHLSRRAFGAAPYWLRPISILSTFAFVSLAWVIFRAADLEQAAKIYQGLARTPGGDIPRDLPYLIGGLALLFFPNSMALLEEFNKLSLSAHAYPSRWFARAPLYIGAGSLLLLLMLNSFYSRNVDRWVYDNLPIAKDDAGIHDTQYDFRANLLNKTLFATSRKKIAIVGSSFSMGMGVYDFSYNGENYRSGTLGEAGNSILNGLRAAFSLANARAVSALVFAISPLNIRPWVLSDHELAWARQCTAPLSDLGLKSEFQDSDLTSCGPVSLSLGDQLRYLLEPKRDSFASFNSFISLVSRSIDFSRPRIETLDLSSKGRDSIRHQVDSLAAQPYIPVARGSGLDDNYHWWKENDPSLLSSRHPIHNAFAHLAALCRQRGIKLYIYTSPTPRHSLAPEVYPAGYLVEFNRAVGAMAGEVGAEFFDMSDTLPWSGRYMRDFVHPTGEARRLLHRVLLTKIFEGQEGVVQK
jgi:D-alanyl-lipoteichoic acid acyltransferase DltB (MBOAT superfamily)